MKESVETKTIPNKGLSIELDGYHHPDNEEDLAKLVNQAYEEVPRRQLRVKGSGHSIPHSIHTTHVQDSLRLSDDDNEKPAHHGKNILLDRYRGVTFLDRGNYRGEEFAVMRTCVVVKAGTHISVDPYDPTESSCIENGICWQLDQKGWALPDLGGITHQTISGFISNGCMGGSVAHSFLDSIVAIRLIHYNEGSKKYEPTTYWKPGYEPPTFKKYVGKEEDNPFWAIGIAMGLLGVISEVVIQCIPRYDIIGQQAVTKLHDCEVDLFGKGVTDKKGNVIKPGILDYLKTTEYTRLEWWPQCGVNVIDVWKARRMTVTDYPTLNRSSLPYREFGQNPKVAEYFGGLFFSIIGSAPTKGFWGGFCEYLIQFLVPPLLNLFNEADQSKAKSIKSWGEIEGMAKELREIPNKNEVKYLKLDKKFNEALFNYTPQQFWDSWWNGLPMDNVLVDKLMPVSFMELFVPIEDVENVMKDLKKHFQEYGFAGTGYFGFEFYASKSSDFWMSMSYKKECFRVDAYWFSRNDTNPALTFFPQFWDLLSKYNFRPHWGKYLPGIPYDWNNNPTGWVPPQKDFSISKDWNAVEAWNPKTNVWPGSSESNIVTKKGTNWTAAEYIQSQYPRWNDFMALRKKFDPYNLFLTKYWRDHLGLTNETCIGEKNN